MTQAPQHLSDMPYEAEVLADKLVQGDGIIGWKGDPRLSLFCGVLAAPKTGYSKRAGRYVREGEVLARRWEVWRHNEDGTDARLISRPLEKLHEIIPELCVMDPRNPGHTGTMDRIEQHNDKIDAEREYDIGQAVGEMTEHLWNVARTKISGEHFFAVSDTHAKQD